MRYTIRLRLANELGEGFTDIPTDEVTARQLIDAGCDSWATPGPYEVEPSRTYVEVFALNFVQELSRQRGEAEAKAARLRVLVEVADTMLESEAGQ